MIGLLVVAVYFYADYAFVEAEKVVRNEYSRTDHMKGLGILFLFGCVTWFYIRDMLQEKEIRKTRYRK